MWVILTHNARIAVNDGIKDLDLVVFGGTNSDSCDIFHKPTKLS